jgi:hypothetical protein
MRLVVVVEGAYGSLTNSALHDVITVASAIALPQALELLKAIIYATVG